MVDFLVKRNDDSINIYRDTQVTIFIRSLRKRKIFLINKYFFHIDEIVTEQNNEHGLVSIFGKKLIKRSYDE